MATRPILERAVPNTNITADMWNGNFDKIMQYADDTLEDAKDYVEGYMPQQIGQAGKFLSTNGTTASWQVVSGVETGMVLAIPYSTVPTGWLECDGSSLLISDYQALYAKIGTTYGAADASHFNLPNFQGAFLRGAGSQSLDGRTFTSAAIGTLQDDDVKPHNHSFSNRYKYGGGEAGGVYFMYTEQNTQYTNNNSGTETRPLNHAVKWIIKY